MKVWKKNMLIAAGGLLAVGVIFCGIGLATGAKSVNYHNGKITIGDKLMEVPPSPPKTLPTSFH